MDDSGPCVLTVLCTDLDHSPHQSMWHAVEKDTKVECELWHVGTSVCRGKPPQLCQAQGDVPEWSWVAIKCLSSSPQVRHLQLYDLGWFIKLLQRFIFPLRKTTFIITSISQGLFQGFSKLIPVKCSPGARHIAVLSKASRLPWWLSGLKKKLPTNAGDTTSIHWLVGKIPWRRKWQPTLVFLSGESHGQWILTGYSPRGWKRVR